MDLTIWECKKVLRRKSCKIALILTIIYALFVGIWNGVSNLAHEENSNTGYNGLENIKNQYKCADNLKGPLTTEKLVEYQNQYNKAYLPKNMQINEDGSKSPNHEAWNEYVEPLGAIPLFFHHTFDIIPEYNSYYSINKIPQDYIKNYYDKRNEIISTFLSSQLTDEKDREVFIKQNKEVKTPFLFDWVEGQEMYIELMTTVSMFTTLFLCVSLAPLFASEYSGNTANILLCSKFGRKKLAHAKVKAAAIITVTTFLLSMFIYLGCQFIIVGTRGLSSPIQLIKPIATAPLTLLNAETYSIILGFLTCVSVIAFTVLLSSKLSSSFPVIIISLFVIFLPHILASSLPDYLSDLIGLFPFTSDYSELFRINLYHLFGFRIWSPYAIILAPIVVILVSVPWSIYNYKIREA